VQQYIEGKNDEMISSVAIRCGQIIAGGGHVLIYTSRKLLHTEDAGKNLEIGRKVSNALVKIVRQISIQPSFLIAKGGVTAHEIASRGLEIRKATVIGQAMPGVPVLVPDGREELKYIVFPGNVGDDYALMDLFTKLTG